MPSLPFSALPQAAKNLVLREAQPGLPGCSFLIVTGLSYLLLSQTLIGPDR